MVLHTYQTTDREDEVLELTAYKVLKLYSSQQMYINLYVSILNSTKRKKTGKRKENGYTKYAWIFFIIINERQSDILLVKRVKNFQY